MNRINITTVDDENEGVVYAGWFDRDRATHYPQGTYWDGHNTRSLATRSQWAHEALFRTAGGAWVLNRWSNRQSAQPETYRRVTAEEAYVWLATNEHEKALAELFAERHAAAEM